MRPPTAAAVVVPVHNEAQLLPGCLDALAVACDRSPVPVHVVLVLDSCTDASSAIAATAARRRGGLQLVPVGHRNVGAARGSGVLAALDRLGTVGTWLLSTDADSVVGPDWIRRHLAYAGRGFDAVAGTVVIDDWSGHPTVARVAYRGHYRHRWGHRHVHGANLGVSASAYVALGGFPPLAVHEDAALIAALQAAGHRIAWAADLSVRTSGRTNGRAPGGMSQLLRILDAGGRVTDAAVPAAAAAPP